MGAIHQMRLSPADTSLKLYRESLASRAPFSVKYPATSTAVPDIVAIPPTMSSGIMESGFRIIENAIKDHHLISDAAEEAQAANVLKTEAEMYSKLECGPACTRLLDLYRTEIHSQVSIPP